MRALLPTRRERPAAQLPHAIPDALVAQAFLPKHVLTVNEADRSSRFPTATPFGLRVRAIESLRQARAADIHPSHSDDES